MGGTNIRGNKLDLEMGYLAKSPCRDCALKKNLPRCSNDCRMLNQLQNRLANLVSCFNGYAELETYSLSQQNFFYGQMDRIGS
ncbi:MAG: hypothetical protein P1P89_20520 [Desulfobacterales bacterium]|nr:hypothetical protein [Desulfobacterales bacterium]